VRRSAVVALLLAACAEPPAPPAPAAPAPPAPPPAVADDDDPDVRERPKAPERPARHAATADEQAQLKAFWAEMQTGRTHTRAGAHAEAIAAFDRALTHRAGNPRALAERGYARLLAKDLEAARADLEAARARSDDPARLGPIWFNLGLVEEAAGDAEAAKRAFTQSDRLRPSKAAKARLAGAAACVAEVDRAPAPARRFAAWKPLYDTWMTEAADVPLPLRGEKKIKKALCHDPKPGAPLWDLCLYPSEVVNAHASRLVGQAPAGELLDFGELGSAESGACQSSGVLTVTPVGELLHARWVWFERDWDVVPPAARDADCDEAYDECDFECRDFSARVDDLIVDLVGGRRLLSVRRTTHAVTGDDPRAVEAGLPVSVRVGADGLVLRGGGCDEQIPLRAP
jgi:hypothetical protein